MSASLVQKSLEIVDSDYNKKSGGNKKKHIFNLISDNQKVTKQVHRKGHKEKLNLLSTSKKLTVSEAQKHLKSKKDILKSNLKKLKQIRQACRIELDKSITNQIIERAVTKRPVKPKSTKSKKKSVEKTAFTEEDFKKFESEYFG